MNTEYKRYEDLIATHTAPQLKAVMDEEVSLAVDALILKIRNLIEKRSYEEKIAGMSYKLIDSQEILELLKKHETQHSVSGDYKNK